MKRRFRPNQSLILLAGFLAVAIAAYFPGLSGGFVYDDWGSILSNSNVQISGTNWAEWSKAAISFPSGTPPFRSLTMLSFAANYVVGGLDPFGFKLTNLLIHLVNGALLFLLLRALFELRDIANSNTDGFNPSLAAAAIAGLWMLLPINLTAVLYVVQRLESLSTTFIFLGLWWYLRARIHHFRNGGKGIGMWLSIGFCTGLAILCKEVGAMLPFYAFLIEFSITGGRNQNGQRSRSVAALYALGLLLPLLVGMAWLSRRYINASLLNPHSDAITRLMTEARVLCDYISWTLVPNLDSLTLYHDDIASSSGLFSPPTTVLSILALACLLGAALWQRSRRPLFTLGTLWFFAGHLLTGTVIPLVLAFEHRNYFSSAGLVLGAASLITLEGGFRRVQARIALVSLGALFYAGTLWMRAEEWSEPLRLARSDALKRPNSSASQYDYAQSLIILGRETGKPEPVTDALGILDQARKLPGASIHFEQTMIGILEPSGYAVPDELWTSIIDKLKQDPPDTNAIHSLSRLNHCFIDRGCKESDLPWLTKAYEAALTHAISNTGLLAIHGEFAWHVLGDKELAETDYRKVFQLHPRDIEAETNLIVVLIHQGKFEEAESMIDAMSARNHWGVLNAYLEPLRSTLASRKSTAREAALERKD